MSFETNDCSFFSSSEEIGNEKKLEEEVIKGLTNDPDFVKELLEEVGEDGGDDAANQVLKKLNEDKDHSDDKNKK